MDDALVHAGPGHLETGAPDSCHLTVRALEPHRAAARHDDAITADWAAAVDVAAERSDPVVLRLTGVTLTAGGILVQAEPVDARAWGLMREVRAALGPLAWFEDRSGPRDIWYASALHFAGPVRDPTGLVAWARSHRSSLDVEVVLDTLDLVRFRYAEADGHRRMAMEAWHRARLSGHAVEG